MPSDDKYLALWECDNGTFDICDEYGTVYENITASALAKAYDEVQSNNPWTQHLEQENERLADKCNALAAQLTEAKALLLEWHDKDWKHTASECLPPKHIVRRTRTFLTPADREDDSHD